MIVESGVIVALGLVLTFWKCSWKVRMWMLSRPLTMDIIIFIVLNVLHAGSFSGPIVAAVGALVCSAMISIGRWSVGYMVKGMYVPGKLFNVSSRLV